jgi:hypothetical protein
LSSLPFDSTNREDGLGEVASGIGVVGDVGRAEVF